MSSPSLPLRKQNRDTWEVSKSVGAVVHLLLLYISYSCFLSATAQVTANSLKKNKKLEFPSVKSALHSFYSRPGQSHPVSRWNLPLAHPLWPSWGAMCLTPVLENHSRPKPLLGKPCHAGERRQAASTRRPHSFQGSSKRWRTGEASSVLSQPMTEGDFCFPPPSLL